MGKTFAFKSDSSIENALSSNLVKSGFVAAKNLSEADIVFVYCETQAGLEDLYFDTNGLIQSSKKGSYLVTLSPTTPGFARELHAVASISDLHSVEAPLIVEDVALPDALSQTSNLKAFVSGDEAAIDQVTPLLLAFVDTLENTGDTGSAQLARAAITIQVASQLVSCMEADALYRAASKSSLEVMNFAHDNGIITEQAMRLLGAVRAKEFAGEYTVLMCITELTAALMTADDMDLILPGAEACMHLLELLAVIGGLEMSAAALSLVYGDESQCAEQGLDWTRAEQTYVEELEQELNDELDGPPHNEYPGNFGGYSSN